MQLNFTTDGHSVRMTHDEALFEVGIEPHRPFVGRVGANEVVALGAVFSMWFTPRQADASEPTATLNAGRVSVRSELQPCLNHCGCRTAQGTVWCVTMRRTAKAG